METKADEIRHLQSCINDLVSIVTLPAIWSGRESTQVVTTLLEALLGILRLEFAYAWLKDPISEAPIEIIRCAQSPNLTVCSEEITQFLKRRVANNQLEFPSQMFDSIGGADFSIVPIRLGLREDLGVLIAGSQRTDFPRETEKLLLDVAANQAVIGLQEARELDVRKRHGAELETKVLLRTKELASLIDTIPGLVMTATAEGEVEFANQRTLEFFGRTADELKRWTIDDSVHPDDLAYALSEWRRCVETGQRCELDHRCRRADGEYRWFHSSALPLRDGAGRILRWYVLLTEIHERKKAEEKLRKDERELRRITEAIPGLIAVMTAEGTVEFINKPVQEYFGRTLDELKDWAMADAVHPDDLPSVVETWSQSLESGQPYQIDHRCRRADGEYRWFHTSGLPLRDDAGRIFRWYVLLTDIQRRKEAEEKLRQDEEELRRITDAIPDMIAVFRPDGSILHLNKVALDYAGRPLEDTQREDFVLRFVHPEDFERTNEERQGALAQAIPFENEIRLLGKDGRYRWFLIRYSPLVDAEGRIIRWYATGTDIEERRQAEERTRNENLALRDEVSRSSMFEEIVGSSQGLRKVLLQVAKVAPVDSTVLISGETGTGKELIARAIHKRSNRSAQAFISVNCGAIPQSLITDELFGHEKGAFTGALQRRTGRFEAADGGTIFLDEIGELPAETQTALLRVLQEREFERLGSTSSTKVDVRVVAATNRDLKRAVRDGLFREDLFYRLNVFPIDVPALRDRPSDIPLLVEYFIDRYCKRAGKKFDNIAKRTIELFQAYHWPGNIRELQNLIERAVVLGEGGTLSVDESWLRREPSSLVGSAVALSATLANRERELIEDALRKSRGRISGARGAAAILGIPRQTLESKILTLKIPKDQFRSR
jgi:formate hydrogenlyase transcriptional activator